MRHSKNKLGAKRVIAAFILAWGFMLTSGSGLLRAQQLTDDLPSKPTPVDSRDEYVSARANSVDSNFSAPDNPLPPSAHRAPVNKANPPSPAGALTFDDRFNIYARSLVSPQSLIGSTLGAGLGQMRNTPPEWGQGSAGYGRRFASAYGQSVIGHTIGFGVAAVDHEDSRFFPSNESGAWKRTQHAIKGTFVSRTDSGGTMPAYSRFAGTYGAAFIANAWEPPGQNHFHDGLERGSMALGWSVGWHVFDEFWPDMRHKVFHHRGD